MKIYIRSSDVKTYRNKRNPNKYLETKKYDDGHTVSRGYMKWDTPEGNVKNYMGSKSNRGRWHRMRQDTLNDIVNDDYENIDNLDACQTVQSSGQLLYPWAMIGEYEDGYRAEMGGNDIGDCIYKLDQLSDKHGELIWYGGLNDEHYTDGEYIPRSVNSLTSNDVVKDDYEEITSAETANKIKIGNTTYKRFYEFDGGVYYTPENAVRDEAWVAIMDDGSIELLYNGIHTPWKDATYEVIEASIYSDYEKRLERIQDIVDGIKSARADSDATMEKLYSELYADEVFKFKDDFGKAPEVHNWKVQASTDAVDYGWDEVWRPYSGSEEDYQSCYIDGEKVGSVTGWNNDGDHGFDAFILSDGRKKSIGTFKSREEAQAAVEDALDM